MCDTCEQHQGKSGTELGWQFGIMVLLMGMGIGLWLGRLTTQAQLELPNKCPTNAFCLVTNSVSLPATNVLWTTSSPILAFWTTNGLQPLPATGCELGLREDGVIVWRQVVNRPMNPVVTNTVPTQSWARVAGPTSEWYTAGMSTNAVPKKKRKWFGW